MISQLIIFFNSLHKNRISFLCFISFLEYMFITTIQIYRIYLSIHEVIVWFNRLLTLRTNTDDLLKNICALSVSIV